MTVEVPDLGDLQWEELDVPDGRLHLELGSDGMVISLTVSGISEPIDIATLLS